MMAMRLRERICTVVWAAAMSASLTLAPAVAADEGGGGSSAKPDLMALDLLQFIAALIAFGITLAILGKLVWPKILKGLDEREAKILGEIENAERARAEAEQARQQYAEELAKARAEASKMIEAAKAEASRAAAELKAQNEAEIHQLRDAARKQIRNAQQAAVEEFYREVGTVGTAIAAKILQREVNKHDQERLIEETLAEITREHAGAQPAGA